MGAYLRLLITSLTLVLTLSVSAQENCSTIIARDDQVGSIQVGKWADFVLLDGPVALPRDPDLRSRKVLATYLAGRATYLEGGGG